MEDVDTVSLYEEFRRQNEELARSSRYPAVPTSFLGDIAEHHSICTPIVKDSELRADALTFSPITHDNTDWQNKVQRCLIEMDKKMDIMVEFVSDTENPEIEQSLEEAPVVTEDVTSIDTLEIDNLVAAEGLDAIEI